MTEPGPEPTGIIDKIERAARRLRRLELLVAILSFLVGAGYVAVMIAWGSVRLRDFVTRPQGSSRWAVVFWYMLFFTLLYNVVHFPVSYLRGYVIERRFRLSKRRFARWLWAEVKKYLVSAILVIVLGEMMYFFLARSERTWWLYGWGAYVLFGLVLSRYGSRVILPLFYKRENLGDEALETRLKLFAERAGLDARAVKRIIVGRDTRRANAAVTGLGSTKEIFLSDTLLELLTAGEIEAVLAHEIAHHKRKHSLISVAIGSVITFVGFALAAGVLDASVKALGLGGVSDVAGFPVILAVLTALFLVVTPFLNYISRQFERDADRWAAEFTREPGVLASALEKLAATNLAQKDVPRYYEVLFSSHPSTARRMAYLSQLASRGEDSP
ncbi:MAG: M48 family metallopeptidase [Planctomycetota bacterium]|jgi:STE24 endopeptidase